MFLNKADAPMHHTSPLADKTHIENKRWSSPLKKHVKLVPKFTISEKENNSATIINLSPHKELIIPDQYKFQTELDGEKNYEDNFNSILKSSTGPSPHLSTPIVDRLDVTDEIDYSNALIEEPTIKFAHRALAPDFDTKEIDELKKAHESEVDELQTEIRKLQRELSSLRNDKILLANRNNKLEYRLGKEIKDKEIEKDTAGKKVSALSAEIDSLKQQQSSKNIEIEELTEIKENFNRQNNRLNDENNQLHIREKSLAEQLEVSETRRQDLEKEYMSLTATISEVDQKLTEFEKEGSLLKQQNQLLLEEKDHIASQLSLLKEELEKSQKHSEDLSEKMSALEGQLALHEKELLEAMAAKEQEFAQQLIDIEKKASDEYQRLLNEKHTHYLQELEQREHQHHQQLQSMETEYKELEQKQPDLEAKNAELSSLYEEQKHISSSLIARFNDLKIQADSMKDIRNDLEMKNSTIVRLESLNASLLRQLEHLRQ